MGKLINLNNLGRDSGSANGTLNYAEVASALGTGSLNKILLYGSRFDMVREIKLSNFLVELDTTNAALRDLGDRSLLGTGRFYIIYLRYTGFM